jgi:peptidyl-prolyl cis-trans isomerase-like 1
MYIPFPLVLTDFCLQYAPRTCENFASLAARGYYNGVPFHRVVPGMCLQGGDPTGNHALLLTKYDYS